MPPLSLALLEITNMSPALLVTDRCAKVAGVRVLGIEKSNSESVMIKLAGPIADLREATEQGVQLA